MKDKLYLCPSMRDFVRDPGALTSSSSLLLLAIVSIWIKYLRTLILYNVSLNTDRITESLSHRILPYSRFMEILNDNYHWIYRH